MKMIEVKTSDLVGAALDLAAAMAQDWKQELSGYGICWHDHVGKKMFAVNEWKPSTDWAQGGPLIEKYKLDIGAPMENKNGPWNANTEWGHPIGIAGDTPLIAAMRAIVSAKLGDTVSVPAELL